MPTPPCLVSGLDLASVTTMPRHCECGCGKQMRGVTSRFCRGHNLNAHRPAVERFWAQVNKTDGCWEWTGSLIDGYGSIRLNSKPGGSPRAHRFSYELHCGPIPQGLQVLHHCDNRKCVRPDHLFAGTQTDNMRDMVAKGRNSDVRGEKNPNARLSADDVAEIRCMRAAGHKRPVVAAKFGITTTMVTPITRGKAWRQSN